MCAGDRNAGISSSPLFSCHEPAQISLATLDPDVAADGKEVKVVWGEPDGGTYRRNVEPYRQVEVRATVHRSPIHEASRQHYRAQN